jgi:hypothetical protein
VSELRRNRYVERVREATRSLFEDLLEANRRLCLAVAVLSEDRESAKGEVDELTARSVHWRAEQQSVLEMLEAADRESKNFEDQFVEIERQNSNLATLYAAGHVLHSSLERDSVLAAIQEIVINLVGSEQFAIVEANEQLTPLACFGVTQAKLAGLSPRSGIIGRAQAEGRPLVLPGGVPADATGVRVCVPLVVGQETRGFVLIFGFLPQKSELLPVDHELFALVGGQAAVALYAAELFGSRGGQLGGDA